MVRDGTVPGSFGQKTWDTMNSEEFWYVPALEPVKIMMKLKLDD